MHSAHSLAKEPRAVCLRCRRPERVCYCRFLPRLETKTHVVLLQHPRERDVPIGTAHMANLCLPNSELLVGVDWDHDLALSRWLGDAARPAVLLYPGEGARDVTTDPPEGPVTLVVVDGTWSQAKKLVKTNACLRSLPRYAFTPPSPSEYRIRREPHEDYVSTIEALMHVLGALEADGTSAASPQRGQHQGAERFRALLDPFRAMVDAQIAHAKALHTPRSMRPRTPKPPRARVPAVIHDRENDLVCVYGEANAWPYGSAERHDNPEGLVHWVALRMSTGELFERVIAPTVRIATNTTRWIELDHETLIGGVDQETFARDWRAFMRDSDVMCSWGTYATKLFSATGAMLSDTHVDMREVARQWANGRTKIGTLDTFVETIGASSTASLTSGRAGRRLAELVAVTRRFAES